MLYIIIFFVDTLSVKSFGYSRMPVNPKQLTRKTWKIFKPGSQVVVVVMNSQPNLTYIIRLSEILMVVFPKLVTMGKQNKVFKF